MPKVVSNSSPLIHLAKLGQIDLLRRQFGEVIIPKAVWRESVEEGGIREDAKAIASASWIRTVDVSPSLLLTALSIALDEGEAEAIALAAQTGADLVLLDERDARRIADAQRLRTTGLIGVLLFAKRQGQIVSLRKHLEQLKMTGFRMSNELYRAALQFAGEGE